MMGKRESHLQILGTYSFWLHVCRNKNAAAAAAKSETKAKVQRAEQILEAQQKRYASQMCCLMPQKQLSSTFL